MVDDTWTCPFYIKLLLLLLFIIFFCYILDILNRVGPLTTVWVEGDGVETVDFTLGVVTKGFAADFASALGLWAPMSNP